MNIHESLGIIGNFFERIKVVCDGSLKKHVNWNFLIIYGYHFLTNLIHML